MRVTFIENTSLQSNQNKNGIILSFSNKEKREAENIWCLFCVRHGFSHYSAVSMLSRMFPGVDN